MVALLKLDFIRQSITRDLNFIRQKAVENEMENAAFRIHLKELNSEQVDKLVNELNEVIAPQIDCTQCGNCCRSFMINVTEDEALKVSQMISSSIEKFKEDYLEESLQGQLIINRIPCHFLEGNSCSIYENRFTECREFPHLHNKNIQQRLFGLLMYYATCRIIYNVMEEAKTRTGFKFENNSTPIIVK